MIKVDMLQAFANMNDAELGDTLSYLQNEVAERKARKRSAAWAKVQEALNEYLNMDGCITVVWSDWDTEHQEVTLGKADIKATDSGELRFHNLY